MNKRYDYVYSILLVLLTSFSLQAQRARLDSLQVEVAAWQLSDPLLPQDTVWVRKMDKLCVLYFRIAELDTMQKCAEAALDVLDKMRGTATFRPLLHRLDNFTMRFHKYNGIAYNQSGDYVNSTLSFQQQLIYAEKLGYNNEVGSAYTYIAYNHRDMEDYKMARQFAMKAQDALKNTASKDLLGNTQTVLASYYYHEKELLDSAVYHNILALRFYEEAGNENSYMNTTQELVMFYLTHQKFALAKMYLNKIDAFDRKQENPVFYARHLFQKAEVAFMEKDYERSLHLLNASLALIEGSAHPIMIFDTYRLKAMILSAMNRPVEAAKAMHTAINKYDEDLNIGKARALTTAQLNFEFERKQVEAELTLQKQKRFRDIALVGLGLGLLTAFLMYRLYVQSKRNAKKFQEKNEEIERAYKELIETQSQLLIVEKQREAQSVRVNIARDIHDELGAGLTKITLLSDLALRKLTTASAEIKDLLQRIIANSKNVNNALSEIVWAVNPSYDTSEGLINYLRQYCNHFLMDAGVDYSLEFPEPSLVFPVAPELKRNIFLVLKEALNNTVKYAGAAHIDVRFSLEQGKYAMTVRDNGVGFSPNDATEYGNGLQNMHKRMEHIGGRLTIQSSPGNGCAIVAFGHI